jgi:hypothetical protein
MAPRVNKDGTIKLHGKDYAPVALRVQRFRERHSITDGWAIHTELVSRDDECVVFRSAIVNPDNKEVAVGFAEEYRAASTINKTSALENCETSAIGRALAAAGFAGTEYASADELANVMQQARQAAEHPSWGADRVGFCAALRGEFGLSYDQVAARMEELGNGRPRDWPREDRIALFKAIKAGEHPELYRPETV